MTPTEAKAFIQEHDVQFVLAQFVDIHGVAKTKSVPADHLDDVLTEGAGFAGFAAWGLGQDPHDHDFMAVGDLSTLTLVPWQPGYARIVCDGTVDGKPWPFDTRYIMKQQLARAAEKGWVVNTGLEPEFMLLKRSADGGVSPADDSDTLEKPCYDYKGLSRSRTFLEKLVGSLKEVGFDVYQIDHEDGNGQFEINYTYTDALTSADRFVFFRMAAGEIANELGLVCSFMPKPFSNRTGSGMHMHISMSDETTPNLFADEADEHGLGLSRMGYQFLGGLLEHARVLAALSAPSVNSYKRLVVGRASSGAPWAPAYISYGDNNRTAMVRIPHGRLELRLADSSCNPYLAGAALVAAGLDGIERELDPGAPQNLNFYELGADELEKRKIKLLPQTLGEALDELERDEFFAAALGSEFITEFLEVKRTEWVEYSRHVSDWETERYLEFY
ncbi:MAG: type III glutamate--ammonia ligase [Gammaproteobacteria bacterium]|nr:type III glutamate--ammonia ligase [Gammaproteobacteria bacterium]